MPIQGTAADILKKAMIDVHAALDALQRRPARSPSRMILTVHDELLFEAPEARPPRWRPWSRPCMETAFPLSVPLTVDVGIGAELEGGEAVTAVPGSGFRRFLRLEPGTWTWDPEPFYNRLRDRARHCPARRPSASRAGTSTRTR